MNPIDLLMCELSYDDISPVYIVDEYEDIWYLSENGIKKQEGSSKFVLPLLDKNNLDYNTITCNLILNAIQDKEIIMMDSIQDAKASIQYLFNKSNMIFSNILAFEAFTNSMSFVLSSFMPRDIYVACTDPQHLGRVFVQESSNKIGFFLHGSAGMMPFQIMHME